jgi:hypothetical protein
MKSVNDGKCICGKPSMRDGLSICKECYEKALNLLRNEA